MSGRQACFLSLSETLKSKLDLATKIYPDKKVFILNESAVWLFNKELHNI